MGIKIGTNPNKTASARRRPLLDKPFSRSFRLFLFLQMLFLSAGNPFHLSGMDNRVAKIGLVVLSTHLLSEKRNHFLGFDSVMEDRDMGIKIGTNPNKTASAASDPYKQRTAQDIKEPDDFFQ